MCVRCSYLQPKTMVVDLQSICFNAIIQQFYDYQYGGTSQQLVHQLKHQGLIEFFSHQIFTKLVDCYPLVLCDDIINLICNSNLKTVSLKGCKNVSLNGLTIIIERCSKLSSLDLSECDTLISLELAKILHKCGKSLNVLKLDSCDTLTDNIFRDMWNYELEILSYEDLLQEQNSTPTRTVRVNSFTHQLTTLSVSGCRNLSSSFVRYLTTVTRSNLKSVNISWTNIDCMALVYLSGYTLSSAVHIAVNNQEAPVPYLKELIEQAKMYEFQNETSNTENMKTSEQSASVYLNELCAYCTQDLALRKCSGSTFDKFSESYEDYEVIDSQVLTVLESAQHLVSNCAEAAKIVDLEWDILSVDDAVPRSQQCTCSSSNSVSDSLCSNYSMKSDKKDNAYRQLFVPNITSLDITQIDFYDFDIGSKCLDLFVQSNPNLKEFHTSWEELNNNVLSCIASHCHELQNLSLVDCERVTNDGIIELACHCQHLKALDLKGLAFVNDNALLNLIHNNQQLQYLFLAESALSDVILKNISKDLKNTLQQLDLSWCENVTDDGVIVVLTSCRKLFSLDLRQCEVTADTVNALAKYGENLTSLGLCGIKGLNDATSQTMVKSMPHLRTVDLSWNSSLVDDSISTLFKSCCSLREVTVAGLKRITSKPFLPIIADVENWWKRREGIRIRLQKHLGGGNSTGRMKELSDYEILDPEFYMPFRSSNYVPHLRKLTLGYCDKLNDSHLAEIVAVCRSTLLIEDYYGEAIKPKWSNSRRYKNT